MYRDIDEDTLPISSHIAPTRALLPPKLIWALFKVMRLFHQNPELDFAYSYFCLKIPLLYVCSWSTVVVSYGRLDILML